MFRQSKKAHVVKTLSPLLLLVILAASSLLPVIGLAQDNALRPLTVIAIGDVGDGGGNLHASAGYITAMYTGEHDAGKPDVLILLGNNFTPTGLNVRAKEVEGKVHDLIGEFKVPFAGMGRRNVFAVPGNHDYYARNAVESKILFGLFTVSDQPVGLSDRGNRREAEIDAWTYHYRFPGTAVYPVSTGARDSVQFIFFDSALPLRSDPATWSAALDSLRRILADSRNRTGITWRILCMHHPLASVGEHGGYSEWNEDSLRVDYLTTCDKDSNAVGWLRNWLDPEDLCADRYREFSDSIRSALNAGGASVQIILSGHDQSLQLLSLPRNACEDCPGIQIVSGAGSRTSRVASPSPPAIYTSSRPGLEAEGFSLPGFAQIEFQAERVRVVFFNARNGDRIKMGEGKDEFWINREGRLVR